MSRPVVQQKLWSGAVGCAPRRICMVYPVSTILEHGSKINASINLPVTWDEIANALFPFLFVTMVGPCEETIYCRQSNLRRARYDICYKPGCIMELAGETGVACPCASRWGTVRSRI